MEVRTSSTANDKLTVYLAGPMLGRSDDDCKVWREKMIDSVMDVNFNNPMDRDYRDKKIEDGVDRDIVEHDKRDIDLSEIVVVHYDKPSVGTSMEILYAFDRGKYILLINRSKKRLSPWLTYHASNIVKTLKEAIEVIDEAAKQYNIYEVGVWGSEGL